ncbi:hypothetical protein AnigIFM63309_010099 [Aspergillus niger]|nr:hypothetical protein AnigIFM63309_010099 [Aspergillus niger]
MSNQPERPWTEEEKYTLLTEILKKARVPSSHLVRMIRDFNITPSWADIPLPPGRSLNSCQIAFCNMLQHVQISVTHSLGSIPPQPHEPSVPATVPLESSSVLRKRPLIPSDRTIRVPLAKVELRPSCLQVQRASLPEESLHGSVDGLVRRNRNGAKQLLRLVEKRIHPHGGLDPTS